ncbi:LysR family transcriptional regulator [Ensifer soli]|uniref:LysR family transcriptional regulator n=1 Tax=Ciceribacter sp. sgz301302 TaxID=3342379 RepID=UPI0035BACAAC
MQDLNDLALFAAVVRHNGFSAAARALNMPKSRLSKHVARLEEQLDVRLLERSTRKLRVTEIGQAFYERCEGILAGVEDAEALIAAARREPSGVVRAAIPPGFSPMIALILPEFYRRYPQIRLLLTMTNRRVDLIEERIDIALRARNQLDNDQTLIVRKLGEESSALVASPAFLARHPPVTIDTLGSLPTLSMNERHLTDRWTLHHADGRTVEVSHAPVLGCSDFTILERAAVEGVGIGLLPGSISDRAFRAGILAPVLPDWAARDTIVHLVFPSRIGLLPAVRVLIDYLAEQLPPTLARCRERDVEPLDSRWLSRAIA